MPAGRQRCRVHRFRRDGQVLHQDRQRHQVRAVGRVPLPERPDRLPLHPLAAYSDGDESPLPALPPILRAPSAGWSLPEFIYAALQSLLVRENAYGLIVDRAGAGLLPAQVELLAPERVGIDVNGTVDYRVDGQQVDPASIWHVRAFTTPGNVVGLSPIAHARQAIGLARLST
jgi:phage portal protein BeeE